MSNIFALESSGKAGDIFLPNNYQENFRLRTYQFNLKQSI